MSMKKTLELNAKRGVEKLIDGYPIRFFWENGKLHMRAYICDLSLTQKDIDTIQEMFNTLAPKGGVFVEQD